jgi:hypothetical protein
MAHDAAWQGWNHSQHTHLKLRDCRLGAAAAERISCCRTPLPPLAWGAAELNAWPQRRLLLLLNARMAAEGGRLLLAAHSSE